MTKLIRIKEGKTVTVYDDSTTDLMGVLGMRVIERATHVEYDNASKEWVATLADMRLVSSVGTPGTVIARCKTRKEAIDAEIAYLRLNM